MHKKSSGLINQWKLLNHGLAAVPAWPWLSMGNRQPGIEINPYQLVHRPGWPFASIFMGSRTLKISDLKNSRVKGVGSVCMRRGSSPKCQKGGGTQQQSKKILTPPGSCLQQAQPEAAAAGKANPVWNCTAPPREEQEKNERLVI